MSNYLSRLFRTDPGRTILEAQWRDAGRVAKLLGCYRFELEAKVLDLIDRNRALEGERIRLQRRLLELSPVAAQMAENSPPCPARGVGDSLPAHFYSDATSGLETAKNEVSHESD